MLFIKYISDKYGNSEDFAPPVVIPEGASFQDMVALKGKSDIGDKINTQVIQPLIDAKTRLARSDFLDFNAPRPRRRVRALEMHRLRRTGDRYSRELWGRGGRGPAQPGSWNERAPPLAWRC